MKIYHNLDQVPEFQNAVVSIGSFDGVHKGHREILSVMAEEAAKANGETVLLTFWPHPRMVLQPENNDLKLLSTLEEKISVLQDTGLGHLVILPFDLSFSKMDYHDFISGILVDKLRVKVLVVGHDHHFGNNREGNFQQLQALAPRHGFSLVHVPPIQINGVPLSSSLIRKALEQGETSKANDMLGYPYPVSGTVVEGKHRGKDLGYPTANLFVAEKFKLWPADGIYAVETVHNGKQYQGMASIGYNPTFGDTGKTLEVNILDFNEQIYNEKITIKFWNFIRKEVKFANKEGLVQQLAADKRDTLIFFANLKQRNLEQEEKIRISYNHSNSIGGHIV